MDGWVVWVDIIGYLFEFGSEDLDISLILRLPLVTLHEARRGTDITFSLLLLIPWRIHIPHSTAQTLPSPPPKKIPLLIAKLVYLRYHAFTRQTLIIPSL